MGRCIVTYVSPVNAPMVLGMVPDRELSSRASVLSAPKAHVRRGGGVGQRRCGAEGVRGAEAVRGAEDKGWA